MSESDASVPNPAEVQQLQEEVDRLKAQLAVGGAPAAPRHRVRTLTAWVLLVIATLLTPAAVVGFWGQQTLVDAERYLETVAPLSESTVIQDAVATKISEGIRANTDVAGQVEALLPEQAKPLAGVIASGIYSAADRAVVEVLDSERFDDLWLAINTRAQQALIKALEGDTAGSVSVTDEGVVLDLEDVFLAVRQELVDRGLDIAAKIPVPSAADREIVLIAGEEFQQLQRIYGFSEPIANYLIAVVAAMFAGAVLLAGDRRRMLLRVGVALVIAGAVLAIGLGFARTALTNASATTDFQLAVLAFYDTMVRYLVTSTQVVVVAGLLIAFVAWLAAPTGSGAAVRTGASRLLGSAGGRVDSPTANSVGAWTRRAKRPLQTAIIVVAVLSLLLRRPLDVGTLTWTLVLGLLALAVIEFLSSLGAPRAAEETEPAPSVDEPAG
jgi:hypothetical protein